MEGKIILNLAIGLGGFIASENGNFDWIKGDGDISLNTDAGEVFEEFIEGIDIIVMGNKSFIQGLAKDFKTKKVFVATRKKRDDDGNIHFISGDIVKIIKNEKEKGKKIYLFGGGVLIDILIKADVIDVYIIGTIPTILGNGR